MKPYTYRSGVRTRVNETSTASMDSICGSCVEGASPGSPFHRYDPHRASPILSHARRRVGTKAIDTYRSREAAENKEQTGAATNEKTRRMTLSRP